PCTPLFRSRAPRGEGRGQGGRGRVPAGVLAEWGPWAWVLVMAIIGVVQLVRQQWFAAALFLLAAVVIGADRVRPRAEGHLTRRHLPLRVLLPVAAAAAVALTVLTRH